MKQGLSFFLAKRFIPRYKRRNIVMVCGVALMIGLLFSAVAMALSFNQYLHGQHQQMYGAHHIMIYHQSEEIGTLKAAYDQLKAVRIVGQMGLLGQGRLAGAEENSWNVGFLDAKAMEMARLPLTQGRMPQADGEIALVDTTVWGSGQSYQLGDRIELLIGDVPNTYQIVGFVQDYTLKWQDVIGNPAYPTAFVAERPAFACYLMLELTNPAVWLNNRLYMEQFVAPLQANPEYQRLTADDEQFIVIRNSPMMYTGYTGEQAQDQNAATQIYLLVAVITVLTVVMAAIGISNSLQVTLQERQKQITLLRAIGMGPNQVWSWMFMEIMLLSAAAVLLGFALGIGAAFLATRLCNALFGITMTLTLSWLPFALSAGLGLGAIFLAAAHPLSKASRTPPVQAVTAPKSRRRYRRRPMNQPIWLLFRRYISFQRARFAVSLLALALTLSVIVVGLFIAPAQAYTYAPYTQPFDYTLACSTFPFLGPLKTRVIHTDGLTQEAADRLANHPQAQYSYLHMETYAAQLISPDLTGQAGYPFEKDANRMPLDQIDAGFGYGARDEAYSLWITGIGIDEIQELSKQVIQGQIDPEKFLSGEEAVITIPGPGFLSEHEHEPANYQIGDIITITQLVPKDKARTDTDITPDDFQRVDRTVRVAALCELNTDQQMSLFNSMLLVSNPFLKQTGYATNYSSMFIELKNAMHYQDFEMEIHSIGVHDPKAPIDMTDPTKAKMILAVDNKREVVAFQQQQANAIYAVSLAIALLMGILSVISLINAQSIRIRARKKEYATLTAIGMSRRHLHRHILLENAATALIAGVIGLILGILACVLLCYYTPISIWQFIPYWQGIATIALLAGVCALASLPVLGWIKKQSVIEQIRDL